MTTKGWSQPWSTWRKDEGDSSDESDWTFDNPGGKKEVRTSQGQKIQHEAQGDLCRSRPDVQQHEQRQEG